jgi:signal transduction histidine kinase/DNA-binding response OmpR family regulator
MRRDTPLSTTFRWSTIIAGVLLHPLMLYLTLPVIGESSNLLGAVAPIAATLLLNWRVGIAATVINVIVSACMFAFLTAMSAKEGIPKAVVSAFGIALLCFGAEKLRRYIEQRRAIEEELNQAKKMEAVGRLAGGVAHDINNTLNSIMASVFAHRQELIQYGHDFQDLDNITAACERGSQLTRNLLGFARKSNYRRQTISINKVIECAHALLKRTANKNIRIDIALDEGNPIILGDRSQIESAVMNLCINSLDAMGEGGALTVTTGKKGDHVFICVRDTGVGMESDVKERVFEPFFTTKAEGKGTGLGLSMVYGVVHTAAGRIVLDTTPGKGTSVTLLFPAATLAPDFTVSEIPPRTISNPKHLSGRVVLLIDDEPLVLRSGARMLRALGFEVLSAGSGLEGEALFKERNHAVDLVIVDLSMPDMDGIALIKALHQIRPSIPAILVSGYTGESERLDSMRERHAGVRFLAKPYTAEELVDTAKELLHLSSHLRRNAGDDGSAVLPSSSMTEKIGIGPAELRSIPLFRDFGDAEVQRLAELFEPVGANEGEILFAQGDAAGAFYILIAGEVSLRQDEREVYLLKPPCLIGELGATTGILRHCRAVVGPATSLRRIDSKRLHDFCSRNPDIGLPFYRELLSAAADKIAHDQRRTAEMREHIIVTQKTMKALRDFILESADSPISRRVHDALEGLIQQNRRANYRVEPPPALAAYLRLDDGRVANVVEMSRTHINFRLAGALPEQSSEISGVLALAGPEIPASGRVLRVQGDRVVLVLDLLLDEFAAVLEGYLARVQMFDFLV